MAIAPIVHGNRLWARPSNQRDDRAQVRRISADIAVGQAEVLAPACAQHLASRLAFLETLLRRAIGAELSPGQVAQADAMAERHMFCDRAAETDFEIVGMRAEHEQIDALGHRPY